MKMKKIIYITIILICSTSMLSCEDFLSTENKSNVTDKQYFSTKTGFESLTANAYEKLRDIYASASYTTYFNAGTDLYADARTQINDELHEYETLNPENSTMKELYTACYSGIRAAYAIKYYAPDAVIDDELRNKRVDEGRVLAANFYFLLVNTFGGVPIMKEYVSFAETGYPRASAAEVYEYIISELEDVIGRGYIESSTSQNGGGRLSIEATRGLLAKVYLTAAWDLNKTEYFTKSATIADVVINNRTLTTPFAQLWKSDYSGDDNEEFIWDVEYDYTTASVKVNGGHPWSTFYSNYVGAEADNGKSTKSCFVVSIYGLRCFEKGDTRYDVTFRKELPDPKGTYKYWDFYKNGDSSLGMPVKRYYSAWYETEEDIEAWRLLDWENRKDTWIIPMDEITIDPQDYKPGNITYEQFVTYAYGGSPCRKFDDSYTALYSAKSDFRDIHIITLSEIFLIASEAYLKAGNATMALSRLNEVRQRAGLTDAVTIDIDVILKERVCELFGQGSRWFDLRRTQKLVENNNLYNTRIKGRAEQVIGQKLLRPIPQAAIDANDLMSSSDQNPDY